jgi:Ser/Thr protein kinase RdoA (MazF antagonist)
LAELHQAWAEQTNTTAVPPAVLLRRHSLLEWEKRQPPQIDSLRHALEQFQAAALLKRALTACERWATPARWTVETWLTRPLPLQPCLCDVWHDHVLFEGDRVSGLVDYGSVRETESVAADLARLVGSLVADDDGLWQIALSSYSAVRPLTTAERELARVLDWTGVVVAMVQWLGWLSSGRMRAEHGPGIVRRLQQLVSRCEEWTQGPHGPVPVGLVID